MVTNYCVTAGEQKVNYVADSLFVDISGPGQPLHNTRYNLLGGKDMVVFYRLQKPSKILPMLRFWSFLSYPHELILH